MARLLFRFAIAFALISRFAPAQDAPTPVELPKFEAADVRVSPHRTQSFKRGGALGGDRYSVRSANMVQLISSAWAVDEAHVVGGPRWLESEVYDIVAKATAKASPENARLMLRALLADRFALKIHPDEQPISAVALVLGKGKPKLKESDEGVTSRCDPKFDKGSIALSCRNRTLEQIAGDLSRFSFNYFTSPVVDQTGLKGGYDFDLHWTNRSDPTAAGADNITIFAAVESQLGLKLEPGKIKQPVLVVESVSRTPTPNAPDIEAKLPAPPPLTMGLLKRGVFH